MGKKSAKRVTNFLGTSAMTRPLFMLGAASVLLGTGPAHALDANTLPQNPNVVGGKDSFSQSGNTLNVNQSTNRTVIDWRSFDIGSKAQVNFAQPGTSSIAVNRVNASANASQIEGGLHANGQVWILNPNGVFFGKTAHVDAAGIVASTANIDANAFMAGSNKLQMTGADHGSVENQGNISVGANGLAAFVAPSVRNSGTINATVGRVALAAGTTYTLDLAGDHLVELGLGSVKAVVDSSGRIVNPGGTIALTAKAAGQVVNSVVNVSGVVSASSVTKSGGTITLGGDTINTAATAQLSADAGTNGNGGAITSVANVQGNYAGSFSAKGGSSSGNGGSVETSGKSVHVDSGIKVNTLASNGLTGSWTVDPDNLTIGTTDSGTDADTDQSISASTVESQLGTTSVNLKANNTITVNTAIDTSLNTDSNTLTFQDENGGGLTINLNADITLGAHETLTGQGTIVNVANTGLIQNGIDVALAGGATVNVAAGQYAAGTGLQINKSGLTLLGASGAEIDVNPGTGQVNAITIGGATDGVTISGFNIRGEIAGSYLDYAFGTGVSRGIVVKSGATNFTVSNNDIENVRTGILVDGAASTSNTTPTNSGLITNNLIDNTKGGLLINYTDGSGITITGNRQGTYGNEWGEIWHLQGSHTGTASGGVQTALLAASNANNGWTVEDQAYALSNRTAVTVSDHETSALPAAAGLTPSDSNQGSYRSPLATIQAGVSAVVAGGTVNVLSGNYTLSNELDITNGLSLIGAGVGVTNITSASTGYGIFVDADNTTLSGFAYNGSAAGSYSFKIQAAPGSASNRLLNFNINNVSISGSKKTGLDLNGVLNATIDHVTVSGTTGGNGIALTDSANVTITNSTTTGNAWGGLALYQNNSTFNQQVNNIVVGGTNSFAEGIYAQDQSATNDFGTVNLTGQGIQYVGTLVTPVASGDGTYTFFQTTEQGAIDTTTAFNARYSSTAGTVQGYDEASKSVNGNNNFYVGYNTGSTAALSIAAANSAALTGATIDVLAGNYTLSGELDITKGLSLIGAGVGVTNITSTSTGYGINVTADNTSLKNFTYHGPTAVGSTYGIKVTPATGLASDRLLNFDIENVTIDQGYRTGLDLNGVVGATIKNVNVSNIVHGNGMALTDSANVTITGSTTTNNAWGGLALYQTNNYYDQQVNNISVDGTNTFNEAKGIYAEDQSTTEDYGTLNLAGYDFIAQWQAGVNDFYTFFQKTEQAAIDMAVAVSPTTSYVQGYAGNGEVGNNTFYVGYNTANTGALSIATAVGAASTGATIDVLAGNYTLSGELDITKSLSLLGAGVGVTNITSASTGYGIFVDADNTTLSGFTYNGSSAGTYSFKVQAAPGSASNRLLNFNINNVSISGSKKTGLDLNGVNGATIDHVTVNDTTNGDGINLTDSANVNITNTTTTNNAWGGLAITQANIYFDQQTNNITVDGTNTFNESNPVFAEDQSASKDFGTINLTGFGYIVQSPTNPNDVYTWFQKTQQNAIDFATTVGATTAYVEGYGSGVAGNNVFTVGTSGGGTAMSIAAANGAASSGATIDVLAGNYTLSGELDITKSLTLSGAGVGVTNITSNSAGYGINVTADNTSLKSFTYHGPTATGSTYGIKVTPDTNAASDRLLNFDIENVTIDRGYRTGLDLNGVLGATIKNVNVSNIVHGNGIGLTDSANVTITGSTTSNNAWGGLALYQTNNYYDQQVINISVDGTNTFNDTIPVYTEDQSASQNFGSISLADFNYVVQSPNNANDVYSWFQKTEQAAFDFATNAALSNNNVNVPTATVQGYSGSGAYGNNVFYVGTGSNAVAMLIGNAVNQAASGGTINVSSGAYAEDVTDAKQLAFNFGDVNVNSFTLASGSAGSTVNGNLTATGAIALNDAATVTGNLKAATFASNATLGMTGNLTTSGAAALNGASNITGNVVANSLTTGNTLALVGNLSATNGVTFGGASTVKGNISAASLTANGALGLTGNLTTSGASTLNGASNIAGNVQADTLSTGSTLTQVGNIAATNGVTLGGASTITGNVSAKTFTANGTLALNGGLTASGAAQFKGASTVNGNVQAASITASNSFGLTGNAIASGAIALNGANTLAGNLTGGSIALGATTLTGSSTLDTSAANGNIAVASVVGGGHALALKTGTGTTSLGDVANAGSITALGAVTLTGTQYSAGAETLGATTLTGDTTFYTGDGNVVLASLVGGGHAATVVASNTSLGNVTNAGAVTVSGVATLTGSTYNGSSFAFGGAVALTNDTTLGATGGVTLASLNGGGNDLAITSGTASLGNVANAGALSVTGPATLTGTSYVAGSIGFGATTLTGNTTLDTSAANGGIRVASVDGTTVGGQSLGINAGSGSVSLDNLGATTRLGAVSDASKTTLAGSTYNANSFLFGGAVTLTSASTTLNTTQSSSAAGDITFQGDLFGTTDAAQSLTLIAGPGTGAASANGNITLQNAGTSAVYLNNLTVTGNNFTALTVDVGGNYSSTLTGNQVFAADTLNVRGNANSTVGGDASGHIVAGGDVTIAANGNVSGTISGQNVNLTGNDVNSVVTASNAANIQGNTVGGSYTAQAVTLIASNNVDAAVNATDFTLAAQHGSVDGTWTTIDTNGSNVVSVNGQTTVGLANVNPNQLVVEGFVLPAGTTIGANGQLILPQGVLLGLLSPGGGKPKMILVHTVHELGELLAAGYSVIVIDLSNKDSGNPIELASN